MALGRLQRQRQHGRALRSSNSRLARIRSRCAGSGQPSQQLRRKTRQFISFRFNSSNKMGLTNCHEINGFRLCVIRCDSRVNVMVFLEVARCKRAGCNSLRFGASVSPSDTSTTPPSGNFHLTFQNSNLFID